MPYPDEHVMKWWKPGNWAGDMESRHQPLSLPPGATYTCHSTPKPGLQKAHTKTMGNQSITYT